MYDLPICSSSLLYEVHSISLLPLSFCYLILETRQLSIEIDRSASFAMFRLQESLSNADEACSLTRFRRFSHGISSYGVVRPLSLPSAFKQYDQPISKRPQYLYINGANERSRHGCTACKKRQIKGSKDIPLRPAKDFKFPFASVTREPRVPLSKNCTKGRKPCSIGNTSIRPAPNSLP